MEFRTIQWGSSTWLARVDQAGALGEWEECSGQARGRMDGLLPEREVDFRDRDDEEARRLVAAATAALSQVEWKRVPGPFPDAPPDAVVVYDGFAADAWTFRIGQFPNSHPVGKARTRGRESRDGSPGAGGRGSIPPRWTAGREAQQLMTREKYIADNVVIEAVENAINDGSISHELVDGLARIGCCAELAEDIQRLRASRCPRRPST